MFIAQFRIRVPMCIMDLFIAVLCIVSIANARAIAMAMTRTYGNLEVDTPESGEPAPDTGLYLMTQSAPVDGFLRAFNACGFLVELNPTPAGSNEIILIFFVAGYRLIGNTFRRITPTTFFSYTIYVGETFGCNMINFSAEQENQVVVQKGDRPGVLIQRHDCFQQSLQPPRYFCSAHVNMIDPRENCSQTLYFNRTLLEGGTNLPAELNAVDGHPMDVFVNLDIVIEPMLSTDAENSSESQRICATKFDEQRSDQSSLTRSIVAVGVSLIIIGLIIIGITVYVTYYYRWKKALKSKSKVIQNINDATVPDPNTQHQSNAHHYQAHLSNSHRSIPNNYSSVTLSSVIISETQNTEDHYEVDESLEEDFEAEYEYADEEDYWEPANQETTLREQLGSLSVKEIPRSNLETKQLLGSGHFADVYQGTWMDQEGNDSIKDVAVKCLKGGASDQERISFLQEAVIMGQFDHPNILQILAIAYSEDLKPILIVDLLHIGDLHKHLLSLRPKNWNQVSQELSPTLLSYSRQIAFGMNYLSCKKFVHRDLAARNVLVANDGTCKIADFGLTRDLNHRDYYISQGGTVPVKWTAPEALYYRRYSTASDVWSYGCLLYEIWSLGCKPFGKFNNVEAVQQLSTGYRLPPPPGCPKIIYHTMIKCWNPEPESRLPFTKIVVALQKPDFRILSWSSKETSESARCLGAPLAEGECLYKTLQRTYVEQTESEIQNKPTMKQDNREGTRKVTFNGYRIADSHDSQEKPLLAVSPTI